MPGLNLLETINREGITTPVLMVTAYGDEHLATQVRAAPSTTSSRTGP